MKLLITGTTGKLAKRIRQYLDTEETDYEGHFVSLRDNNWMSTDFGSYDAVIHTAGIINSTAEDYSEYRAVNVDLTRKVTEKAIKDGARQLVYISSMAVYDGISWGFGEDGLITRETKEVQSSMYGRSKFEAEQAIEKTKEEMNSDIRVCIVRAPSVVGKGMEDYFGRYLRLAKGMLPIPAAHYEAKRSFVYVDTLIEFILLLVERVESGVFYPQNLPMLSATEMMEKVAESIGKKKRKINGKLLPGRLSRRLFRQICYSEELSREENMIVGQISSYEAIKRTIEDR